MKGCEFKKRGKCGILCKDPEAGLFLSSTLVGEPKVDPISVVVERPILIQQYVFLCPDEDLCESFQLMEDIRKEGC